MKASIARCAVAWSGAVMMTDLLYMSDRASAPGTAATARSASFTQVPQHMWTLRRTTVTAGAGAAARRLTPRTASERSNRERARLFMRNEGSGSSRDARRRQAGTAEGG